jgi:excisionase family DNA binding protein
MQAAFGGTSRTSTVSACLRRTLCCIYTNQRNMKKRNAAHAAYTVPTMFGTGTPIRHPRYPEEPRPAVYSIPEAANALGIGPTTVKALIKTGDLPSVMLRRRRLVRVEAVALFLAARERGGRKQK